MASSPFPKYHHCNELTEHNPDELEVKFDWLKQQEQSESKKYLGTKSTAKMKEGILNWVATHFNGNGSGYRIRRPGFKSQPRHLLTVQL